MTKRRIHAIAGTLAACIIAAFFTSSIVVEIAGNEEAIALTKTVILITLLVLVPSMAITGATGHRLAAHRGGPGIGRKKRRMITVGLIGVGVLIPCAITLQRLAVAGEFGTTFYLVQLVELVAGGVNVSLLALNIRDGRMLAGKIRPKGRSQQTAERP